MNIVIKCIYLLIIHLVFSHFKWAILVWSFFIYWHFIKKNDFTSWGNNSIVKKLQWLNNNSTKKVKTEEIRKKVNKTKNNLTKSI